MRDQKGTSFNKTTNNGMKGDEGGRFSVSALCRMHVIVAAHPSVLPGVTVTESPEAVVVVSAGPVGL